MVACDLCDGPAVEAVLREVRPTRIYHLAGYADALLRFAHAVVRRAPQAVEAFTLGTRLTRVTQPLRHRDPERALAEATRAVPVSKTGIRAGQITSRSAMRNRSVSVQT